VAGAGIGQIVGGHVDGLHRSDGALFGGSDALLQLAHLGGQVRLVADGGRHAAQQRRNLRSGLREAEDVVDEQQRVRAFDVAEVLGDGEGAEGHAQASSWRLSHLAIDQRAFGVGEVAGLDHARLGHFNPKIVALAGALAHAGKHRVAAVVFGHVVDELHDDDGLAHARAAEKADLAALQKRLDKVDDLDAGLKHLFVRCLLIEQRSWPMDGHAQLLADGAKLVDRLADDVDDAAQRLFAHGYPNGPAEIFDLHAAHHAVGCFHGHRAHAAFAEMLLHFQDDRNGRRNREAVRDDAQRLINGRHRRFFKLHVDRWAGNLNYLADIFCHCSMPFRSLAKIMLSRKPRIGFDLKLRSIPCLSGAKAHILVASLCRHG
jgi:hypothetical protein